MTDMSLAEYNAKADAAMSEAELQAWVWRAAKQFDWLPYHTYNSQRSQPGFPDLCMVRNGVIIFAELKRERGKLTAEQVQWQDVIGACDGRTVQHYVWRPSDRDEILEILA